jgi:polyisoprenoid-binding protein YceI
MSNLPLAPGTWTLDPHHSSVQFKVRHLGLTNVRGRFNKLDSTLVVGESLDDSSLNASIAINSIDTNQADRDGHLLGTDFFSAEKHPELTFASTAIKPNGDDEYTAEGDLTINGVTRPVALAVEFTGRAASSPPPMSFATTSASTSTCPSAPTSWPWARRSGSRSTSSTSPRKPTEPARRYRGRIRPRAAAQLYGGYLIVQAVLGIVFWVALMGSPAVRSWFELMPERREVMDAFVLADVAVVVAGSGLGAWALWTGRRWAVPVVAFTAGGVVYPTLYLVAWTAAAGTGALCLAIMVPVAILTTWIAWQTYRLERT